jgi:hypothetical protein
VGEILIAGFRKAAREEGYAEAQYSSLMMFMIAYTDLVVPERMLRMLQCRCRKLKAGSWRLRLANISRNGSFCHGKVQKTHVFTLVDAKGDVAGFGKARAVFPAPPTTAVSVSQKVVVIHRHIYILVDRHLSHGVLFVSRRQLFVPNLEISITISVSSATQARHISASSQTHQ